MRIGVDLLWSQVLVAVAKQARDAVQPLQAVKAAVAVAEGHRQGARHEDTRDVPVAAHT